MLIFKLTFSLALGIFIVRKFCPWFSSFFSFYYFQDKRFLLVCLALLLSYNTLINVY